jgi:Tol biopolymer transport system component
MASDGGEPIALIDAASLTPVVSPDGRHIAFWQMSESGFDITIIPAEGGPPEKVLKAEGVEAMVTDFPLLYWSPDGKRLVLSKGNISSDAVIISNLKN